MLYGLQSRQGLLVLTGEAGTGKTTLIKGILESLKLRGISTAYVFHPLLEPVELVEFILRGFNIRYDSHRKGDLIQILHQWLIARDAIGDCPVLIMDEAQGLSVDALDELRLLLNLETAGCKFLQIILAGQSELEEKLKKPQLRQLRQRVVFHCKLPVFAEEQTVGYVRSRLATAGVAASGELFPEETLQRIHLHAKGIPRVINLLCEHALITAFGEQQKTVSLDIIEHIAMDFDLSARPLAPQSEYTPGTFGRLISFPQIDLLADLGPVPSRHAPHSGQTRIDAALERAAAEAPEERPVAVPEPSIQLEVRKVAVGESRPRFAQRPANPFKQYWKGVAESFVEECRQFYRPIAGATPVSANSSGPKGKSI